MTSSKYIVVNFDQKEYITPEAFGERADLESVLCSHEGVLTALAVLLSDGNGRGGGDLHAEHQMIGKWAGCRIAIIDDLVKDAELSEPGLADVPLYEQITKLGKDVSLAIMVAINEGERSYWTPGQFNPESVLSLVEQREMSEFARKCLLTAKGRALPMSTLEEFFGILSSTPGLTPYTGKKRLQEGLHRTRQMFQSQYEWDVVNLQYVQGNKEIQKIDFFGRGADTHVVKNVTSALRLTVARKMGDKVEEPQTFTFALDLRKGATANMVYKSLFPDVVFEKPNEMTENLTSPEVIRLMKLLSAQNKGA